MTIDQKALEAAKEVLYGRHERGFINEPLINAPNGTLEAAITTYLAALPTSDHPFPSHRFDGAMEVPSYTSNSSAPAPAHEHAGLVERLETALRDMPTITHGPFDKAAYRRAMLTLAETVREAATALSAGARVWPIDTDDQVEALARECDWDNRRYMSPADYAVWCERMRKFSRLAALSDAPVVMDTEHQVQKLTAENERLREALTPSADTKAAYMGEFCISIERHVNEDGEAVDEAEGAPDPYEHISVPWTTIKEIMAAIRARSALETQEGGE